MNSKKINNAVTLIANHQIGNIKIQNLEDIRNLVKKVKGKFLIDDIWVSYNLEFTGHKDVNSYFRAKIYSGKYLFFRKYIGSITIRVLNPVETSKIGLKNSLVRI